MRLFVAATLAVSLFASNLLAAEAVSPLAAGKPAGVKKAQDVDDTDWWLAGGVIAVAVIAVAASGNGSSSVSSSPVSSPSST
jgi:di/tricarboxylate transporter